MAVLRAAINYGTQCRVKGCADLLEVIKATSRYLAGSIKREIFFTSDQVIALRKAAHKDGRPNMALAYALVFETTIRLYDVILELDWSHIDADEVLKFTPTKTERKTGLKVLFPLKLAPMVQEELAFYKGEKSGPVILMEGTDRRYSEAYISKLFRDHADAAGIPKEYVARDLRSSGITEARMFGADLGDLSKVAGHSSTQMTSMIYDRAALAAAQRVANIRIDSRTVH